MVVVGTNGELLSASNIHRLALTKTPNVDEAFAWQVELIDDDRGRRESQQKRIEGKSNFQRWLTDWVDTSKRDWQAKPQASQLLWFECCAERNLAYAYPCFFHQEPWKD